MSVQSNHHSSSPSLCTTSGSSSNKSKKSKNDILRQAVGILLKQKNFVGTEKFRKSDFILLQNKKSFVVQKMLEADMHNGNSFVYSNVLCMTNNYTLVDQQFARFSQFVDSQHEDIRSELKRFYAPLVCHLYLELIKGRETKAAVDFMRKYAHLIAPTDTYEAPFPNKINGCSLPNSEALSDASAWQHLNIRFCREAFADEDPELEFFMKLIQKLSACQKLESLETDPEIAQFRSAKFEMHTSELVVNQLQKFLENRGHVLILNLIYSWINVHILENEVRHCTEEALFMSSLEAFEDEDDDGDEDDILLSVVKSKSSTASSSSNEKSFNKRPAEEPAAEMNIKSEIKTENSTGTDAKDVSENVKQCIKTLKESRDQIMKSHFDFPRIIKISDKNQGLSCAVLDAKECHLVAGFNSSSIQLWQLDQCSMHGKNLFKKFNSSHCQWEMNNFCEEDEDEMDEDIRQNQVPSDAETDYIVEKYYGKKYEDNSYNSFGGIPLRGHGAGITDIKFSSHYPLIYSTSKDSQWRCWKAENAQCAAIYRGHRYPIWCMDESPVGMYVATGSRDLTARLWSLEKEFPFITYAGHTQDVECIAFHPNGTYLATGSADFSVRLWCVTSGKLMRVFADCKQSVCCIAFSPDGKMLAAGGEETKIRIFDIAAGSQLNELKDHTATVSSICWSPNGRYLSSGCRDGSMRVWDVKKLTPMSENSSSSSSSSSSSATLNRLLAVPTNCQRLVKVFFSSNESITCLGT